MRFIDFVMSWRRALLVAFLAAIVFGIQLSVANRIAAKASVVAATCAVTGYEGGDRVALSLKCGAHDLKEDDVRVVLSHIRNPGPLSCKIATDALKQTVLQSCNARD